MTFAERLPELDFDGDTLAIMQLHSNTISYHQQPSIAFDVASVAAPAAKAVVNLGLTPDQVATGIANAVVASSGLDQQSAQDLISRIDVPTLANGLADVFGDYSAVGDLGGDVDVSVRFDPAAAEHVITAWLDNVAVIFADEGISTVSASLMLSTWLANAERQMAEKGGPAKVALLETSRATIVPELPSAQVGGYNHVVTSFAKGIANAANGTATVRSDEEGGPIEVNLRVSGVGFMGLFSSWLGDLAASFEEVGVRDAIIRAGLSPEDEEETWNQRQHLIVSLLAQKGQLSSSSSRAAREARELAVNMVRGLLTQTFQRSQMHAASLDATDVEKH